MSTASEDAMVRWSVSDRIGHLQLNRAQAGNAINLAFARALATAVEQAKSAVIAGEVGALLLTAGGKAFCVGGDIQSFVARRDDLPALVDDILRQVHPAIHALATLPVPVISVVQGALGGAGIALALCADFVLAADTIKLRGGYTAIGLSPDAGASWFVTRRAGAAAARRIFMRNQALSAQDCLQLGLVDELHAPEELLPAAQDLARQLARGATGALAAVKELCDSAAGNGDLHAHLQREHALMLARAGSPDSREGIRAFIEKRAPDFSPGRSG